MARVIIIIIFVVIIWAVIKGSEGFDHIVSSSEENRRRNKERDEKFGTRTIDSTKPLLERNLDIINEFSEKVSPDSYQSYHIENLVRDCLNDICLAEKVSPSPGSSYLSTWKRTAPPEFITLANTIQNIFSSKKEAILESRKRIHESERQLNRLIAEKNPSATLRQINMHHGHSNISLQDISEILNPNSKPWRSKEDEIIQMSNEPKSFPLLSSVQESKEVRLLNKKIERYNAGLKTELLTLKENSLFFSKIREGFRDHKKEEVVQRTNFIINDIDLPSMFPKTWKTDYDPEESILIVEIELPDVTKARIYKELELKSGITERPLNQKESKEFVPKIHPSIVLRVAYEIFRNDSSKTIQLLVLNGWINHNNPVNGIETTTYVVSLAVSREQIITLNLPSLDPLAALLNLKGKSAGTLIDIVPIVPVLSLNREDKRFVPTKEVLNNLNHETNLASMDWQDFESLIAELFGKEFSDKNAEVKVTQASRDRGVDAIVFDPDPIKGGKFIIQAKRYTNVVDVSAVRDLCAVVKKEGASRGILVTTSTYGSDAYVFAQNEPITLLNGAELLGLLEKHGYNFKIDLKQARDLLKKS